MHSANWDMGESGSEQLFVRRNQPDDPHFDITAMVDLVFMMNIYFLVTFILVAGTGVNLPSAVHCSPLDPDTAVVVTLTRSPDGKASNLYLADDTKGQPLREPAEQQAGLERYIQESVARDRNKSALLIKAEKNVHLADMFRVSQAAAAAGLSLHVAVLEKNE